MTVRDSITRTRARTPGAEDDPTSTTVCDRALGPTQCGISDVATKCTKGGRKPNICRCMLGAVLSRRCLGRHRLRCQPCSRIGENPPYGMIGGIEETSASSKPDPRLDPTRRRGACHETHVPTATCARQSWCDPAGGSEVRPKSRSSVRLVASVAWPLATVVAKRTQQLHGVWD